MDPLPLKHILFATSLEEERIRFVDLIEAKGLPYSMHIPENLQSADMILSDSIIDLIITDTSFADGAFADWLSLWPRPFILLADYGEERRIDDLIRDEACSFILRDSGYRHIGALPTMLRKVLNIRESLDRQNVHLQISERRYLELVSAIPDIVYSLDHEGHFIYINDAVYQLGYKPAELLGKHFSIILDENDVPKVSRDFVLKSLNGQSTGPTGAPKLFDERRSGQRMTRNLVVRLQTKPPIAGDGPTGTVDSYGEISCVGLALPEYEGSSIGTVGIIRDITQRRHEEMRLRENLHVKEILLKEIHHRIKNNLQVVSSLLNLQSSAIRDPESLEIFFDSQTQIQSMAMVHEHLYQSDDLQSIDVSSFLSALTAYLFRSYDVDTSMVKTTICCSSIYLGIEQSIPLALIVNELVCNSIKHGLARSSGTISIGLEDIGGGHLRLEVKDSGTGLPEGFEIDALTSLGMQLVRALGEQLSGTLSWESNSGTQFRLVFPFVKPRSIDIF